MVGQPREIAVVLLAAGKGMRMRSRVAKVLHPIAGRPMLAYPLAAAEGLGPARLIAVVGTDAEVVEATFAGRATFVRQEETLGPGHAVLQARSALEGSAETSSSSTATHRCSAPRHSGACPKSRSPPGPTWCC